MAPISFTIAGMQSNYIQKLQNAVIIKDFMLKGIDIYMTRIQVMRDWQSDNNRQNTHFDKLNMVSPKVGSFHGTANNTSNNLFNTSLAVNR